MVILESNDQICSLLPCASLLLQVQLNIPDSDPSHSVPDACSQDLDGEVGKTLDDINNSPSLSAHSGNRVDFAQLRILRSNARELFLSTVCDLVRLTIGVNPSIAVAMSSIAGIPELLETIGDCKQGTERP